MKRVFLRIGTAFLLAGFLFTAGCGTEEAATSAIVSEISEEEMASVSSTEESGSAKEAVVTPSVVTAEETAAPVPSIRDQRVLFLGDSRTIDMFADSDDELAGAVVDGITIYARHGHGYSYMADVIGSYGVDNFDVLISWMGGNDHGHFERYGPFYDNLLAAGKTLILCTVGPTADEHLLGEDTKYYTNERMVRYNNDLIAYANSHGIRVIDLYGYIAAGIAIDPADGIHYTPRPTTAIWQYILASLP